MIATAEIPDATRGTFRPVARNAADSSSARKVIRAAAKNTKIHLTKIRLAMNELPRGPFPALAHLHPQDAAAILTHSFDQDVRVLAGLLTLATPPAYLGVLGPHRRTRELLAEATRLLNLPASSADAQAERWLAQLHAPMGLDLGAESPEAIALCIVAEVQKSLAAATGRPLRELRAVTAARL